MIAPAAPPGAAWRAAGRAAGAALTSSGLVVVVGTDVDAAAEAALGIGEVQTRGRRVAVGDLSGGVGPLASLATAEDEHGLVDCFLYGVSLNRIARPVPGYENLFVLPAGTGPVDAELFANPRWRRLAAGFREVGALLLLVVSADGGGAAALAGVADGVVSVGDAVAPPEAPVLARIAVPATLQAPAIVTDDGRRRPLGLRPPRGAATRGIRFRRVREVAAAGVVAAVGLAVVAVRYAVSPRSPGTTEEAGRVRYVDSAAAALPPGPLSAVADAAGAVPTRLMPADSAAGSPFAVEVAAMNTIGGALDKLQELRSAPAATFSPVVLSDRARWFKVIVGAAATGAGADSTRSTLQTRGALDIDGGAVLRAPYALLVEDRVAAEAAPERVRGHLARGLPVYALLQPNGSARLYAGAFETPEQSALLAIMLREAGLDPTIVYRTGRPL